MYFCRFRFLLLFLLCKALLDHWELALYKYCILLLLLIFRHEIRFRFRIQNHWRRREQTKTFLFPYSIRVQYKNVADSLQIRKKVLSKLKTY